MHALRKSIFLLLAGLAIAEGHGQARINEVCSRNSSTLLTADGDSPDWVEVVNDGPDYIDLSTFWLSDDSEQPFLWQLPAINLAQGEIALLHSGDGADGFPFSIDGDGERIYLSGPGVQTQELQVPRLEVDNSFGRAGSGYRYFGTPTPGLPNTTTGYLGYAPKPSFNRSAGYADAGTLILADAPGATVRWTTDGRPPDESSAEASAPIIIDSTTVVLARSFQDDYLPSATVAATFVVNTQRQLPIVSLAVDPDSMFHETYGLYMLGPNADPDYPHYGANFWSERALPIHIEFFEPNGERGLDQQVEVKMHGGRRSRNNPQRPLRLTARGRFGGETMRYPFFPERPGVEEFKTIILRNSGGDFCVSNFRDGLFHQISLHNGLDIDELAFRPAICYINGRYWGLVEMRERIDNDHLHYDYGADPDAVLMMEEENQSLQGDTIHSWLLQEFIRTHDLNEPANWAHVDSLLDIHSFMDYFALEMIAGNVDWPSNNLKYWKPSVTKGKWRYAMYDLDATMVLYGWIPEDLDMFQWTFEHRAGFFHTELFRGLMGRDEFKRLFMNRMADLMNTVFRADRFQSEVDRITNAYATEIEKHFERWGCWFQVYQDQAFGIIPHFVSHRDAYMRQHAIDWFGWPNDAELEFEVFPPASGTIRLNTIEPALPFAGWYWNGNDIDLTAQPSEGYTFSHWGYSEDDESSTDAYLKRSFAANGRIIAYFSSSDGRMPLFPNPARGTFTIGIEAPSTGVATVQVSDMSGRLVLNQRVTVSVGMNRLSLDAQDLAPGSYTVRCETGGTRHTARLVRE